MRRAISPDDLRAAWEAMSRRAELRHWSRQGYERIMGDPIRSRLVQLEALALTRAAQRVGRDQKRAAAADTHDHDREENS